MIPGTTADSMRSASNIRAWTCSPCRKSESAEQREVGTNTLREINSLLRLAANWDCYGARPIDGEIVDSATQFVRNLSHEMIEKPRVIPLTHGRMQFEWNRGPKSLEIEFEEPGKVHFLKCDDDQGIADEGVILAADEVKLADLLRWFFTAP